MTDNAILSIDQGTSNSKAILLDKRGHIIASGSAPLDTHYPQPGWVEQSADTIWKSVVEAIAECVAKAPTTKIQAIGISNQRESVVAWDRQTGQALAPVITWQCRRTTADTERMKALGHEPMVLAKTGLPLDPLFPASKIRWLIDHVDSSQLCIGTVDSWLVWNLTAGERFATDRSNAARTQLLNVQSGHWDPALCALFRVDVNLLPEVVDSKHQFGHTKAVPGLPDGIPVAAAIGDSHAALFGHAAFTPGEAKTTFGTGSSVMMVSDDFTVPQNGMTSTIAWSIDGQITYALEGNILVSASLFPWTAELLGLAGNVDKLMEMAESVVDAEDVMVVPALAGLGAPHWNPEARGIISGLSFSSTPAHIAHAAALSMSYQVADVFDAMYRQTAASRGDVFVDGGPTRNLFLMQSLADLLAQPVCISKDPELSALGAGMLAGLHVGFWSGLDEIRTLPRERTTITPTMPERIRLNKLFAWQQAVIQCQYSDDMAFPQDAD